ncbi:MULTISPECIES: phosphate acetyltransferase [Acinetobacter]|jgi:phosphate acetyltransferase|uniref:phosphate acetyltransferase n=1 Tax=Acinetobacter TaxID=469 RepID=UPI0004464A9E|nr:MULTISPECIES: phosphate acetyltransferase [Acinetobacter]MDQ9825140.1 phosphate acetyltransferase [Acinetobacter sp. 163]EHU1209012.1 phosphate acetyltransferase [Acinetobacter nosocomialis]EXH16441.1 phosphate acetyltransferase [Acinetobacter sp. 1245593]EXR28965.1 phosphate acetyltransferase [Acinetobacter sp. 1281984]MBM9557023.1 phosphate acetyltransferase [Acinetobacter nosocomialis]
MNTILLIPTGEGVGLTSACLGMIYALDCNGIKAGFLKPFSQVDQENLDRTTSLFGHLFQGKTVQSISHEKLTQRIASGEVAELLEEAVSLHRSIAADNNVIIVEGLLPNGQDHFASELNASLAQALDAEVVLVSTADIQNPRKTAEKVEAHLRQFGGPTSNRTAGVLFMRTRGLSEETAQIPVAFDPSLRPTEDIAKFTTELQKYNRYFGSNDLPIIGLVPFSNTLSVPRTLDIANVIDGQWVHQGEAKTRRILHSSLIASSIEYELNKFIAGELIISASERTDVLLASSLATSNGIPLAGLVLTEREAPAPELLEFCQSAIKQGLPILHTRLNTLETAQRLSDFGNEIPTDDTERAEQVTRFVSSHIDVEWLKQHSNNGAVPRLSPSAFRHELVQKSIAAKKRIVLPEGDEPRTIEAAAICQARGIAHCILLAKPDAVQDVAKARGIELPADLEIIDPDSIRNQYVAPMVELRKGKLNELQAKDQLQDTVVLGTMMLALDHVDGLVSGAVHTTANTVRPAFQLIKTAPSYSLVSSIFFMLLPDEVYVYGDCAINPDPTADQLAEIAIQSADSAKAFGIDPRIAMISYSTGTSGTGADVEKVQQATQIAQQRRPDLLIDGPLQYDAASVESVGRQKAPNSPVAGRANVFIFPDLNTGNTTYKAVQRAANVVSVGPMLQGLNKPVNDLSRGALVDDIVFTIALTAIQAEQQAAAK